MLAGEIYPKADKFSLLLKRTLLGTVSRFGHCILRKLLINWKETSRSSENSIRKKNLGEKINRIRFAEARTMEISEGFSQSSDE